MQTAVATVLKAKQFQEVEILKKNLTIEFKAVSSDAFADYLQKRCIKCITSIVFLLIVSIQKFNCYTPYIISYWYIFPLIIL